MPAPRHIPALVAASLALLLSGCGDSGEGLLNAKQAAGLTDKLDAAQQALDNDRCQYAEKVALEGAEQASQPRNVDPALQRNLVEGFNQLAAKAESACASEEETPTSTATPDETVTETPTAEPTAEETPVPTVTAQPTETPTEAPTVVIPTPEPTSGSGGAEVPDLEQFDTP